MTGKISIQIVSDIICPWCVVGYKHLETAIAQANLQNSVDVLWEPFELNPNISLEGEELYSHLAKKYGMTRDDCIAFQKRITDTGAKVGFTFDFYDEMRTLNTQEAHILSEYARSHGRQTELQLQLFKAFFSERQDISSRKVLSELVERAGLDVDEALDIITDAQLNASVRSRKKHWRDAGITSVPTMIFNETQIVSGAQSVEIYKQLLTGLAQTPPQDEITLRMNA